MGRGVWVGFSRAVLAGQANALPGRKDLLMSVKEDDRGKRETGSQRQYDAGDQAIAAKPHTPIEGGN